MEKFKNLVKDAWGFFKRSFGHFWTLVNNILKDLTAEGNTGGRLGVFVIIYLIFSVMGAYNFAHLIAFFYIIWLLERK
jgi:hypothetical protein